MGRHADIGRDRHGRECRWSGLRSLRGIERHCVPAPKLDVALAGLPRLKHEVGVLIGHGIFGRAPASRPVVADLARASRGGGRGQDANEVGLRRHVLRFHCGRRGVTLASCGGGGADVVAAWNKQRKLDNRRRLVGGCDWGERERRAVWALHCPLPTRLGRRRRSPRNDSLYLQGGVGARRQVEETGRGPGNDVYRAGHVDITGRCGAVGGRSRILRDAGTPAGARRRLTTPARRAARRSHPARVQTGRTTSAVGLPVNRRGPCIGLHDYSR